MMTEDFKNELEQILAESERKDQWASYAAAVEAGNWKLAHDVLQAITLEHIKLATEQLKAARRDSEENNRQIKTLEQKLGLLSEKWGQ